MKYRNTLCRLGIEFVFSTSVCCFGCMYELLYEMRSSVPCDKWNCVERLMVCVTVHRLFLLSYLARKTRTGAQENYK